MTEQNIIPNGVYNVKTAAKVLRCHLQTVVELCRESKLRAVKIKKWIILGQNIIDFVLGKEIEGQNIGAPYRKDKVIKL